MNAVRLRAVSRPKFPIPMRGNEVLCDILLDATTAVGRFPIPMRSNETSYLALAAHSPESCASETARMCSISDSRRLSNRVPS